MKIIINFKEKVFHKLIVIILIILNKIHIYKQNRINKMINFKEKALIKIIISIQIKRIILYHLNCHLDIKNLKIIKIFFLLFI